MTRSKTYTPELREEAGLFEVALIGGEPCAPAYSEVP